jgi:hypothetical protein
MSMEEFFFYKTLSEVEGDCLYALSEVETHFQVFSYFRVRFVHENQTAYIRFFVDPYALPARRKCANIGR